MKIKCIVILMVLLLTVICPASISTTDLNVDTIYSWDSLSGVLRDKFGNVNTELDQIGRSNIGTGNIYYVDSEVGSDSYVGTKWEWATATLDAAINLCEAGRGDVIFAAQGHAESISSTGLVPDTAGIKIIGCGDGDNRPTFTLGKDASITVSGANIGIYNCIFATSSGNLNNPISFEAAAPQLVNCDFRDSSSVSNTKYWVKFNQSADNAVIAGVNCYLPTSLTIMGKRDMGTNSGTIFLTLSGTAGSELSGVKILGCNISGRFSDAAIGMKSVSITDLLIANCNIKQASGSQKPCISAYDESTGFLQRCSFQSAGNPSADYLADFGSSRISIIDCYGSEFDKPVAESMSETW